MVISLNLSPTLAQQEGSDCGSVFERATPKFAVTPSLIFLDMLLVATVWRRERHTVLCLTLSSSRHINCVRLQKCGRESDTRVSVHLPCQHVRVRGEKRRRKSPNCLRVTKVPKTRSGHVPDVKMSRVTPCSSSLIKGFRMTRLSRQSAVVTFSPKGPQQIWKTFKSSPDGPFLHMGGWGVFWLVPLRRNGGRSFIIFETPV
jgi:hypothetical protein